MEFNVKLEMFKYVFKVLFYITIYGFIVNMGNQYTQLYGGTSILFVLYHCTEQYGGLYNCT